MTEIEAIGVMPYWPGLIDICQGQDFARLDIRDLWLNKSVDLVYAINLLGVRYEKLYDDKAKCDTKDGVVGRSQDIKL